VPVPLIDLLLRQRAPETPLGPGRPDILFLDGLAVRARQAYRALTDSSSAPDVPGEIAATLALITAPAQSCSNPAVRKAWHEATFRWGGLVIPVLTRSEQEEFWATLRRQPCAQALDESGHRFLAFQTAVALRRTDEVRRVGLELLASPGTSVTSPDQYVYVAQATAAAAIGESRPDDARQILDSLRASVGGNGVHVWDMLVLESLAQAGRVVGR